MNHIDITFDMETCATTVNAAVMQVAAVAWDRRANENPFLLPNTSYDRRTFNERTDLHSCVMDGFDFDPDTVRWWAGQKDEAKTAVMDGKPRHIRDVFARFAGWIVDLKKEYHAESVCLWCQGMDFDGAILRNVCKKYGIIMPFAFQQFRDCRTLILEAAVIKAEKRKDAIIGTDGENYLLSNGDLVSRKMTTPEQILADNRKAYALYERLPLQYGNKDNLHDALYDCLNSSWNTWQALKIMKGL